MKSEVKYKGNPIRGILVIIAFAAITIFTGKTTYSNEQTITYFFESSTKKLTSEKTGLFKIPNISILSTPTTAPHLNLVWKPMPSSTPTASPAALFNSTITPSERPIVLKMLVSASLTGNTIKFNVSLVDQDSNPVEGTEGFIEVGGNKYILPPTDPNGDTSLTTTITTDENILINESASGVQVSDTLNVSN